MPKKRKCIKSCDNCGHCVYMGEGDFACMFDASDAVLVKEEWIPTSEYISGDGKSTCLDWVDCGY